MTMPYGKIDIEGEALKLYDSDEREQIFSAVYERYPAYQTSQMFDALDYVMDRFEELFASKYSEVEWRSNFEHLGEPANFLVHVNVLARLFRGKMLAMLMDAHDANQLTFFNTHTGTRASRLNSGGQ